MKGANYSDGGASANEHTSVGISAIDLEQLRGRITSLEDISPFALRDKEEIERHLVDALVSGPRELRSIICASICKRGSNIGSTRKPAFTPLEILRAIVGANATWCVDAAANRDWNSASAHLHRTLRVHVADPAVEELQRDLATAAAVILKARANLVTDILPASGLTNQVKRPPEAASLHMPPHHGD